MRTGIDELSSFITVRQTGPHSGPYLAELSVGISDEAAGHLPPAGGAGNVQPAGTSNPLGANCWALRFQWLD